MTKQYLLAGLLLMGVASCKAKQEASIVFDSTPRVSTMSQAATLGAPGSQTSQVITVGPKDGSPAAQPPGLPPGAAVPPGSVVPADQVGGNAQPNSAANLPPMPKNGPSPAKFPTPEKAPKLPPESALRHSGDTIISPSGLKYIDLKPGTGPLPKRGQTLSVSFVGRLANGRFIDESKSFTSAVGEGQLIPGWDEGLLTMRLGSKRRLIIPPGLAFGEKGTHGVPPNAVVIYDVEVILIQD